MRIKTSFNKEKTHRAQGNYEEFNCGNLRPSSPPQHRVSPSYSSSKASDLQLWAMVSTGPHCQAGQDLLGECIIFALPALLAVAIPYLGGPVPALGGVGDGYNFHYSPKHILRNLFRSVPPTLVSISIKAVQSCPQCLFIQSI